MHHESLHSLYQATLDVASLRGLHGHIDELLPPSHGMEVELCWCQAGEIRVLHEPFTLWAEVVFEEVWQGSVTKTKRYTFSFYILLTHTSYDLVCTCVCA